MTVAAKIQKRHKKRSSSQKNRERLTVGEYLLKRLDYFKVRYVFGASDQSLKSFVKLIEYQPHIQLVESVHSFEMAMGYSYLRQLGCVLTYPEELKSAIGTLEKAFLQNLPLVVVNVTKTKKSHEVVSQDLQELDSCFDALLKKCTCHASTIDHVEFAAKKIDRLLDASLHYKQPVYLELPQDLINAYIPRPTPRHSAFPPSDPENFREAFLHAKKLIDASKRPYLCTGQEIRAFQSSTLLIRLATKLNTPICTSTLNKAIIPEDHPLSIGSLANSRNSKLLQEADLAILCGKIGEVPPKTDHTIAIFSNETSIDGISYPHVHFLDLITHLAESSWDEKKGAHILKATEKSSEGTNTSLTIQKIISEVSAILTDELVVVSDTTVIKMLPDLPWLQGKLLVIPKSPSECFGALFAYTSKRVILLLSEEELQNSSSLISIADHFGLTPIIIWRSTKQWNYNVLPTLLKGTTYIQVSTQDAFSHGLQQALHTDDSTLLEVVYKE